MAFSTNEATWDAFLAEWPLERLRTMRLEEYTRAGDRNCLTSWLENGLDQYGSIWGGSAFKFGIYARASEEAKTGGKMLAYDDKYGWYRQFGDTREAAFEAVRAEVVAVAEAARVGRLSDVDVSRLGPAYRWKIAFHYQDRNQFRLFPCVFLRNPLLFACGMPEDDKSTPLSTLYGRASALRGAEEPLMDFSRRVWRDWVMATPLRIKLTDGAVRNGYIPVNLVSAPFPESIRGGDSDAEAGETVRFRTDTGWEFDSDVRAPGSDSGRIRTRFGQYFRERNVQAGDTIQIQPDEEGVYVITHFPKGAAPPTSQLPPEALRSAPSNVATTEKSAMPVNRILFGPPGTGKTYHTVNEALNILDPAFLAANASNRRVLKQRFDEFTQLGQIRFVTFHQSFSYEDFVEGIRAQTKDGQIQYRVEPGVFRAICEDASGAAQVASDVGVREGARIWKISIDGTGVASTTRQHCFSRGEARIGWSEVGDLTNEHLAELPAYQALGSNDKNSLRAFSREIEPGDVLLCIGSENEVQAVGVVQGEYEYQATPPSGVRHDYVNVLPVRWLATGLSLDIRSINGGRKFTLKTVYEITRFGWPELAEYMGAAAIKIDGAGPVQGREVPHVLVIDEINRGNVSRIFGELITLIEPSKRKGALEALEVELPYSRKKFSVPSNVHLIGTMNTADRSLAGLDVALRRRFEFVEMMPNLNALASIEVAGVPIDGLLAAMNRRIEVLLGRDYMLGHAYFLPLEENRNIGVLAGIFRLKVLPLLQEYFFEDWQRIAWVLNDHRKPEALRFLRRSAADVGELLGLDVELPREGRVWQLNDAAFDLPEAYQAIIRSIADIA